MHNDEINRGFRGRFNLLLDAADVLLPCPFCGGTRLTLNNTWTATYWIECQDCDAEMHGDSFNGEDERGNRSGTAHRAAAESAIDKWNTRVVPIGPAALINAVSAAMPRQDWRRGPIARVPRRPLIIG